MNKEYIQALYDLFGLVSFQKSLAKEQFERAQKYFDIIEEALQRLEAIDNAKSSRALECLEVLGGIGISHTETEQDEDFNGEWVYDTVTVNDGTIEELYYEYFNTIENYILKAQEMEKALQRLEQIDNTNPNEALNQIDFMILDCVTTPLQHEALNTVKQALLKAQEQEKVIEAIKKHFNIKLEEETELNGNVWGRLVSIQAKEDNGTWDTTATANLVDYKEDFDLLRECFKYE